MPAGRSASTTSTPNCASARTSAARSSSPSTPTTPGTSTTPSRSDEPGRGIRAGRPHRRRRRTSCPKAGRWTTRPACAATASTSPARHPHAAGGAQQRPVQPAGRPAAADQERVHPVRRARAPQGRALRQHGHPVAQAADLSRRPPPSSTATPTGTRREVVDLLREMDAWPGSSRSGGCGRHDRARPARGRLVLNDEDEVDRASQPADTSFSHTIIEMFMVEANEAVAELLTELRRAAPSPHPPRAAATTPRPS